MYVVDREDKESWFASRFALLLELGYGFTVGLIGNVAALIFTWDWFLPHSFLSALALELIVLNWFSLFCLLLLQLAGFVYCLIDLSRRHTYQSWVRITLVAVGLVLNCLPIIVYLLITGGRGDGFL